VKAAVSKDDAKIKKTNLLECMATGDPHVEPFIGGRFDLEHTGVFTLFNHGNVNIQAMLTKCRKSEQWSGGLTLKCINSIAVQVAANKVVQLNSGMAGLFLNGKKLGASVTQIGATSIDPASRWGALITNPDFHIRMWDSHAKKTSFLTISISIKDRKKLLGKSAGVCGGGRAAQFSQAVIAKDLKAKVANKQNVYPCRNCQAAVGGVGAICSCSEFAVDLDKQLFNSKLGQIGGLKKSYSKDFKQAKPGPLPAAKQEKIKAARAKCLADIRKTPFGAIAWAVPSLRTMLQRNAEACALDKISGLQGGRQSRFNRRAAEKDICVYVRDGKQRPSRNLCKMMQLCGFRHLPGACG